MEKYAKENLEDCLKKIFIDQKVDAVIIYNKTSGIPHKEDVEYDLMEGANMGWLSEKSIMVGGEIASNAVCSFTSVNGTKYQLTKKGKSYFGIKDDKDKKSIMRLVIYTRRNSDSYFPSLYPLYAMDTRLL